MQNETVFAPGTVVNVTTHTQRFATHRGRGAEFTSVKQMEIGSAVEVEGRTVYRLRKVGGKGKGGQRYYRPEFLSVVE